MQKIKSKIAVVGLGNTGLSCIEYLMRQPQNIIAVDSRPNPPKLDEIKARFPKVSIYTGSLMPEILAEASHIILSPGVSINDPDLKHCMDLGIPIIGDIELFAQNVNAPVIAITGSNGKSTVTSLVGEMAKNAGLKVRVGGNLGTPALDLLADAVDLYVLELSSFQLETTCSLKPNAAVVLNISPDHLDRHKTLAEYIAIKMSIYRNCQTVILNRDENFYKKDSFNKCYPAIWRNFITFGLGQPKDAVFGVMDNFLVFGNERLLPISALKIKGSHQVANALAALALGKAADLPMAAMLNTLREFKGLSHRCQHVETYNNVGWYDDSKGTNVGATYAAIAGMGNSISGKIVLIAGGQGKNADFSALYDVVKKYVRTLVLIGEDASKISQALRGASNMVFAESMSGAVKIAREHAVPNDVVLLSPACASFDMFTNFEHRGQVFAKAVIDEHQGS